MSAVILEHPHSGAKWKDIKIKLPARQILRLYDLRIVTGRKVTTLVEEALTLYFAQLEARSQASKAPPLLAAP